MVQDGQLFKDHFLTEVRILLKIAGIFFLCRQLTDKKKETINDKSKDYDIKQKEDNKTKNTAKNQKSSNLSLRNKKEEGQNLLPF